MCEEILYAALPQRTDDNFPMRLDKVLRVCFNHPYSVSPLIKGLINGHSEICPFRQKSEPAEFLTNHDSAYLFNNRLQTFKGRSNV